MMSKAKCLIKNSIAAGALISFLISPGSSMAGNGGGTEPPKSPEIIETENMENEVTFCSLFPLLCDIATNSNGAGTEPPS